MVWNDLNHAPIFLISCAGRRTLYETILITLHLGINQLYNDKLRVIPTKEEWAIKEQNYNMAEELIAKQAGRFFRSKILTSSYRRSPEVLCLRESWEYCKSCTCWTWAQDKEHSNMTWEGMVGRGKTESTGSVCVVSWSHGDLMTSSYFLESLIIGILLYFFFKKSFHARLTILSRLA